MKTNDKYKLICMSFDGTYVTEKTADDINALWQHSEDIGSRWFFYPFHFVCTEKTIASAPDLLTCLEGKRITTVQKLFELHSQKDETQGMDVDDFVFSLLHW